MPFSPRVKKLAYAAFDPACWKSYSGQPVAVKRQMDARRLLSLRAAQRYADIMSKIYDAWRAGVGALPKPNKEAPMSSSMPALKINMMLHFYYACEPFAPERTRRSEAYTKFVRELLRDGMIERPTDEERAKYPGWAYRTTAKGECYVDALRATPLPVQAEPRWVIPQFILEPVR